MVFRAWFAIPERLTTSTGKDTRGAYGFLTTFLRVIREHSPSHIAVTFDTKAPTFRDEMFPEYKAHRPPVEPELHEQIPIVKDIMKAFNVPIYELDGYEADDLVGTLSKQAYDKYKMDSIILTGDADQLQLVDNNTKVLMYTGFNSKIYGIDDVVERYDGLAECWANHPMKEPTRGWIEVMQGEHHKNIKMISATNSIEKGKHMATEYIQNK